MKALNVGKKSMKWCYLHAWLKNPVLFKSTLPMKMKWHVIKYYGGDRNVVNDLLDKPKEYIVFSITFDHKDWSKGERSKYLVVDVYEEYQVWNGISLIGNIGFLVGFSFLGCSDWFIKIVPKAWKWATRSFKTSNDMEMAY